MDGLIEDIGISEGLMGEMVSLQVTPDDLDVIEFRRIFRQPLNGKPMGALGERRPRCLADVDRAVVEHNDGRLRRRSGLWAVEAVDGLQVRDEVGAAFGAGGGDDEPALGPIERPHHGNLLGLPRRRHAQVRATLGPGAGQIGMCQRLTLIGEQEHDVASLGLRFTQPEPQTNTIDGVGVLTSFQRVPRPTPAEPPFLRSTLESCDREIVTASRVAISSARRANVQFVRFATGAERSGPTTLSAAAAFTGTGPGATLALRASTPPLMKSLRQSRTVSSRTPKASAILALVQPPSVNRMARARSASARSEPPARALSAAF